MKSTPHPAGPTLPPAPIDRITKPIQRYLHIEAASGLVLLAATACALILANSPWAHAYHEFWKTSLSLQVGSWSLEHSLEEWINDGLMVLFFFVIGLEVKYELVLGELRGLRQALLPIAAAIGGMVVPAGVYLALQHGEPGERGWGIPMATDIAFVVGCMALLGKRVPHGLRVLLLTLAIADDIGAILVIAVGYSSGLNWMALALAGAGLFVVRGLALLGVRSFLVYTVLGLLIWLAFLTSGVHATLAGVILGLLTPARQIIGPERFREFLDHTGDLINGPDWDDNPVRVEKMHSLRQATREIVSPLAFLQTAIHPWVSFVIMPVFALANAGVTFQPSDLTSSVSVAAALGLVLGKPLGILLACWLAVWSGLCRLPEGVGWRNLGGGACLGGIGFTMALFIASLAMTGTLLDQAKLGVLVGSVVSAMLGAGILLTTPVKGEG